MKITSQKNYLGNTILKSSALLTMLSATTVYEGVAQTKPADFVLGTLPAASSTSYDINGYGPNSGSNYFTNRTYSLNYGKTSDTASGFNRIVKIFNVEGETYSLTKAVPGALPYLKVNVNRYGTEPEDKITALFEVPSQPSNLDNSSMYLTPDYVNGMGSLINSYVINRGTDNVFVRGSGSTTTNNITRIDLILENSVTIPATLEGRKKSGFLLMERGGNDNFKIAAITGISGTDTTVSAFGSLVPVASANWGTTGQSIFSVVMQKSETDVDLKPSQFINSQPIAGVFISLEDLGIPAGDVIYGISLMGNNVTDPEAFPTSTADADGGLDFMAGGGFFTRAILVEGNVWNDADGDAVIAASGEPGVGNGIWANLVDNTGKVISSVLVNADGTYKLFIAESNIGATTTYSVILTNEENYEGDILTAAASPKNDYYYTGTNSGGVADVANTTGIIELGTITGDVSGVNFGIQRAPVADPKLFEVAESAFSDTPPEGFDAIAGYKSLPMSSANLVNNDYPAGLNGALSGSDPEDCGAASSCNTGTATTFNIESINSGTRLFYDFGAGPVEIDLAGGPVSITNFDVAKMVIYGQNGASELEFAYSITDKAGAKSSPVAYRIVTDAPLPVILFNFQAVKQNEGVLVKWSTAAERNSRGFEIERSSDNRNWKSIAFVKSKAINGNSTELLEYGYSDFQPLNDISYYRLKQTDNDGKYEYSIVRQVSFAANGNITFYPNPAKDYIIISGLTRSESILVFNAAGKVVRIIKAINIAETIGLDGLENGTYHITVISESGKTVSQKVIKL